MARCTCDVCKEWRRLSKIIDKLPKRDKTFLIKFYEDKIHVEMEKSRLQAMLEGSWPESEGIHKAYLEWRDKRFKNILKR